MNADLRIPLTADQKRFVAAAAARDQSDIAGWVRPILLKAAAERLERRLVGVGEPVAPTWLEEAMVLAGRGKKEESLDVIFDALDDLLLKSKFKDCDEALASIVADRLSNAQLLTVLTATLQAKSRLPSRAGLVSRVKSTLHQRGADVKGLMSGLN